MKRKTLYRHLNRFLVLLLLGTSSCAVSSNQSRIKLEIPEKIEIRNYSWYPATAFIDKDSTQWLYLDKEKEYLIQYSVYRASDSTMLPGKERAIFEGKAQYLNEAAIIIQDTFDSTQIPLLKIYGVEDGMIIKNSDHSSNIPLFYPVTIDTTPAIVPLSNVLLVAAHLGKKGDVHPHVHLMAGNSIGLTLGAFITDHLAITGYWGKAHSLVFGDIDESYLYDVSMWAIEPRLYPVNFMYLAGGIEAHNFDSDNFGPDHTEFNGSYRPEPEPDSLSSNPGTIIGTSLGVGFSALGFFLETRTHLPFSKVLNMNNKKVSMVHTSLRVGINVSF